MTLTPEIAQAMELDADQTGALVEEVVADSPAEKAELQASSKAFDLNGEQVMIGGDVITAVDGKTVKTMQDLSAAIKAQKPGDEVELTVLRNGEGSRRSRHPGRAQGRSGCSDDADGAG